MRIAVCDDQIEFQNILLSHLNGLKGNYKLDIATFDSGERLIESVKDENYYNIFFLDIQMENMNGIEVAEVIRKYDKKASIIFITSHPDYAIDGYKVSALHYLLKPITSDQFMEVFKKAVNNLELQNKMITINSGTKVVSIDVSSILYIESYGREVFFYTKESMYKTYSSFSNELERLEKFNFAQSHRCYMVNLAHVKAVEKQNVLLSKNIKVPLSRKKHRLFYSKYSNYVLG